MVIGNANINTNTNTFKDVAWVERDPILLCVQLPCQQPFQGVCRHPHCQHIRCYFLAALAALYLVSIPTLLTVPTHSINDGGGDDGYGRGGDGYGREGDGHCRGVG